MHPRIERCGPLSTKITQGLVRSAKAKPSRYEVRDSQLKGFMLRIAPSGRKSYYVEWARGRKIKLGDVGVITLTKARADAMTVLSEAANNQIPSRARKPAATLGEFISNHYEPWAAVHNKSGHVDVRRLQSSFNQWLEKPLESITPWLVGSPSGRTILCVRTPHLRLLRGATAKYPSKPTRRGLLQWFGYWAAFAFGSGRSSAARR